MINVGDEKGEILDRAVRRASPERLLELGTYCGYSGLRMARAMPAGARLYSIEYSPENAEIARRIWTHAGVADRLTVIVGTLGDGGATIERLRREHGFGEGALDFVFVDHDKSAYLPDLERILEQHWLRPGALVVADNVKVPGRARLSRLHALAGGQVLAHRRARHARRVPVNAERPRARVGVPRRGGLRRGPTVARRGAPMRVFVAARTARSVASCSRCWSTPADEVLGMTRSESQSDPGSNRRAPGRSSRTPSLPSSCTLRCVPASPR